MREPIMPTHAGGTAVIHQDPEDAWCIAKSADVIQGSGDTAESGVP
jgi:hypothetical protein